MLIAPPPERAHASLYATRHALIVHSNAVYRSTGFDDQGLQTILDEPVSLQVLGVSLRTALDSSRFLKQEEVRNFFDLKNSVPRYERWVTHVMSSLQVTTRRSLFKGLLACSAERMGGRISITPSKREGAEGWGGLGDPTAHVHIDATCTDVELGIACRLALSRCMG